MESTPVVGVGPLSSDIVYIHDESSGRYFRIGARGGGSLWNALSNASVNGAKTLAYCVGGADEISRACVRDLQNAGVKVTKETSQLGKRTRTLHEILSINSVSLRKPKHDFTVRCPVCNTDTYMKGTARVTKEFMKEVVKDLKGRTGGNVIIHIDGVDTTRLMPLRNLGGVKPVMTLDLGRSTGIFRMHQASLLERLQGIDVLFVHSRVLPELKRLTGSSREKDIFNLVSARVLITTKGEKGISYWIRQQDGIAEVHQEAAKSKRLLDTAGAGDALVGFFLARLASKPFDSVVSSLEDVAEIDAILKSSQAWAAKKCGFVGARGHIGGPDGETWSWDTASNLIRTTGSADELRLLNLSRTRCISCSAVITETSQTSISTLRFRQNVIQLPMKVESAWKERTNHPWEELRELERPGYVVGTGGSFAVAYYAALMISGLTRSPVIPIRPFDFIRNGVSVPTVVFISNSGKTRDVICAMEHALTLGVNRRVLITGVDHGIGGRYLRPRKDLLLSTGANGERGFLSVAGTVVPCFMIYASLSPKLWEDDRGYLVFHRLYEDAKRKATEVISELGNAIFRQIRSKRVIILGGGWAWPAMLDAESKMVESALGQPEISEIKDYSHGRFVSSIDSKGPVIVFGMPDDKPYREFLIKKLRKGRSIITMNTDRTGGEGALELMLQTEHFMRFVAEKAGIDLSAPNISPRGLQLYRYPDILNFETGASNLD